MTNEPSPRPWQISDGFLDRYSTGHRDIVDAKGEFVAVRVSSPDAALIVDAVNERAKFEEARMEFPDFRPVIIAAGQRDAAIAERDRLRDIVRRLLMLRRGDIAVPMDIEKQVLAEARAAIGEGAK